ncbi:hypothetical protein CTAYLR_010221 [Chrysophaeum taylorii]|uniref:Dual specificity phosphatase catalytic domain-containing protein n=1 Tax=Chrysophaeum taylorii TaxID=2483200 RepID=A0AAD7XHM3_9STRA|nr:hypothetical protein CTAYLR_010221 [Chrysophaeum taylorii]
MAAAEACVMPRETELKGPQEPADEKKKSVAKRRGGRANSRRKEKNSGQQTAQEATAGVEEETRSNFDCSGAIAQICEGLWVSAVSGTRMGASLEAALLEKGVTGVLSTLGDATTNSETFEHHTVDVTGDCLRPLHAASDFINESISEGGVVFIHSKAGFARSEWAVLTVLGYMIKYQNHKLLEAIEALSDITKHTISPAGKFRRELVQFEEEALGEASVTEDWVLADETANGTKNHSLSRRKLAENLNDRRLLKKKSPHK